MIQPVDNSRNILRRYGIVLIAATLPLLGYTVWQAIRRGGWRYLQQRLGHAYKTYNNKPIWLHAASVGEVIAAEPLINKLHAQSSAHPIIVTTATPTGSKILKQRLGSSVDHFYLPIDWTGSVNRFIQSINPCCSLIMETELWPNLYAACSARSIPIVIINGRLSKRTLETHSWIKTLYKITLHHVTAILARSKADADGFLALGAEPAKVHMLGNIKFGAPFVSSEELNTINLDRPYVLAASTHEDEEIRIAKMWLSMESNDTLLVIAPRHPDRSKSIIKQLTNTTSNVAVRSKGDSVDSNTEIYLADTLGELAMFINSATVVFMGGSLVPVGGHNILEPALLGTPIIFGPYMENFAEEARLFLQAQAVIQVANETELMNQLLSLLSNKNKRKELAGLAQSVMKNNQNIVNQYVSEINRHCNLN
jgi:3-deoxy-D-manno-octulosonic-acid transferase